jgi:hypothetical protein
MQSFSFLFFFWALVQHANADCDSGDWAVLLLRSGANEAHCTDAIDLVIDAQMQACVSSATGGIINRAGHHSSDEYYSRRHLADPEHRELRTAPLQQERQLACNTCLNCQRHYCILMEIGGAAPYCSDTCGAGCICTRRLESGNDEDNQDERKLSADSADSTESPSSAELMTERCKWDLKAFAENLIQDAQNYCLGDPELLNVTAYCV